MPLSETVLLQDSASSRQLAEPLPLAVQLPAAPQSNVVRLEESVVNVHAFGASCIWTPRFQMRLTTEPQPPSGVAPLAPADKVLSG